MKRFILSGAIQCLVCLFCPAIERGTNPLSFIVMLSHRFFRHSHNYQGGEQSISPPTERHSPLLENKLHRHFLYSETYTKLYQEAQKIKIVYA